MFGWVLIRSTGGGGSGYQPIQERELPKPAPFQKEVASHHDAAVTAQRAVNNQLEKPSWPQEGEDHKSPSLKAPISNVACGAKVGAAIVSTS